MTKRAIPKEGPRAPLFYSVLALVCAGLSQAQTVDISELEQCAGLDAPEAKLACFEAIATGSEVATEVAPELVPESAPEVVVAPASRVTAEPGPPAAAPQASVPRQTTGESSAAQSPAGEAPAPIPSGADRVSPATSDDSFGGEHLGSVEESRSETLRATVVDVTTARFGELIFHLDNGQGWTQMEKRYYPYPRNQQFEVVISIGMLNEYRLQVGGVGRKVTVKRVK